MTIKDIAKRMGVSYATVSRALNGRSEVSEDTRRRVLKLAEELGYQPNAIARGLVKNSTSTIGLLIPDITNPFYPELALGVDDAANEIGYSIFLCNTDWDEERESKYLKVLRQNQVDGIIIAPSSEARAHLETIVKTFRHAVFINKVDVSNCTSILIDNIRGAQLAVEHLIGKGHRDIAFIGGLKDISSNLERLEGYRKALEGAGIPIGEEFVQSGDFHRESGQAIMSRLLRPKAGARIPSAVFAANDILALGAIQAIMNAGLRIPSDIAVVGFDDIPFASLPEVQLTTIAQPKYDMGRLALRTLVDKIRGKDSGPGKKVVLEPELKIRATS